MGSLPSPFPLQKIHTVAIIGFGISGVASALHLKAAGLSVTVYERSSQAGGIWLYDSRLPIEPRYPATRPSVADVDVWNDESANPEREDEQESGEGSSNSDEEDEIYDEIEYQKLRHAPPGPAYKGLKNNVPTTLMQLKGLPWNPGTPEYVNHAIILEYIQSIAQKRDLEKDVLYNTRVEHILKEDRRWLVRSITLTKTRCETVRKVPSLKEFDAVVVASGHYHAPKVPDIPGLKEWKQRWPTKVQHSKSYRDPEEFRNQNVLLVGASTSSTDIARELDQIASQVYQSSRGGAFDLPPLLLPANARRVNEIKSFDTIPEEAMPSTQVTPVLGAVTLHDGTTLRHIQRVIVATGYQHTLPFLPALHNDRIAVCDADDTQLITDGTQVHNLHKDIFYIPDPTLAFIGLPYYSANFALFEFQAIALTAAFAGRAKLPSTEDMRSEYRAKVENKGFGRAFHSVKGEEVSYADELLEWVNKDGEAVGADRVEGHSKEWRMARVVFAEKLRERLGLGV